MRDNNNQTFDRSEAPKESRAGLWSSIGAVITAVISSACCWLPLALVSFGASAAGVSGFFDIYRIPFLALTAGLLSTGFYFTYRAPNCEPDDACAVPKSGVQRVNKILLWTATVFVVLFATFPNYIGALIG